MPKANFKVGKGVLPEREKEGRKKGKNKDTFEKGQGRTREVQGRDIGRAKDER